MKTTHLIVELNVAALAACMTLTAFADIVTVDEIEWSYSMTNGMVTIGPYSNAAAISKSTSGALVIPNSISGCPVVKIDRYAFSGCQGLSSVEMPSTITEIGDGAFYFCRGLTKIKVGSNVAKIGSSAFNGCENLVEIRIPRTVKRIGGQAFYNCKSLTTVIFDGTVSEIGLAAFYGCEELKSIEISDASKWGSVVFVSPESNPLYYGGALSRQNGGLIHDVEVPGDVLKVNGYAFYNCDSLKSVRLDEGVMAICAYSFYDCNQLTDVEIPSSVTNVGKCAFAACPALRSSVGDDGMEKDVPFVIVNDCLVALREPLPEEIVIPAKVRLGADGVFSKYVFDNGEDVMVPNAECISGKTFYKVGPYKYSLARPNVTTPSLSLPNPEASVSESNNTVTKPHDFEQE